MVSKNMVFVILTLSILVLASGCTRSQPEVSKLKLSIPYQAKAANVAANVLTLEHLVINVTGPGITSTILYIWDQCHNCPTPLTVPVHSIPDVPTGSGRLIQVLGVYSDDASPMKTFFYGEASADLSKTDEEVSIAVASLTNGIPLVSGRISGRYLSDATSGPTGEIEIQYQPPNGRPALVLDKASIANGWFSLFGLKGVPLRYVIKDTGLSLFGTEAYDLADRTAFMPGSGRMKVFVPVSSYQQSSSTFKNNDEGQIHIFGYFGPGAGAKVICTNFANGDKVDHMYKYGTTVASPGNKLGFEQLATTAAEPTDLSNLTTPASVIRYQGGVASTAGSCVGYLDTVAHAADNVYTNFLPLSKYNFNDGGDGVAGFRYPLGLVLEPDGSNSAAAMTYGFGPTARGLHFSRTGSLKVAGRFLPGIGEMITAVKVFKIPDSTVASALMEHGDAPCLGFINTTALAGASLAGTSVPAANGGFLMTTSITEADIMSNGAHAAVCVETAAGMRPQGFFLRNSFLSQSNSSGNNNSSGPYARLDGFQGYQGHNRSMRPLTNGKCYPVTIRTYEGMAQTYAVTQATNFTFTNANFQVYASDASCLAGTGAISSVGMSSGATSAAIYVKPVASGSTNQEFTMTIDNPALRLDSDGVMMLGNPQLKALIPSAVAMIKCFPFKVASFEADGVTPYTRSGDMKFSLTMSGGSGTVRTDSCAGSTLPGYDFLHSSSQSQMLYYIAPSTGSPVMNIGNPQGHFDGFDYASQPIAIGTGAISMTAAMIKIEMDPGTAVYGGCVHGRAVVMNAGGILPVPTTENLNVELTSGGRGQFYSGMGCSGNTITSLPIYKDTYESHFWFRSLTNHSSFTVAGATQELATVPSDVVGVTAPTGGQPYLILGDLSPMIHIPVIGSHEFDSSGNMEIPISASGTFFECSKYGGSSTVDCTANISIANNKLKIHKADLNDDTTYHLRAMSSSNWFEINFRLSELLGHPVSVVDCGSVFSGATGANALTNGVNCLSAGATLTVGTGESVNLSDKSVIGSMASRNQVINTSGTAGFYASQAPSGAVYLANLEMPTVANQAAVMLTAGTTIFPIKLSHLKINFTGLSGLNNYGVFASGLTPLSIEGLYVDVTGASEGVGLKISNKGNTTNLKWLEFVAGGTDSDFTGMVIYSSTMATTVNSLKDSYFQGVGSGISMYAANTYMAQITDATNVSLQVVGGSFGTPLMLQGPTQITLTGAKLLSSIGPVIGMAGEGSGALTVNMLNSRVIGESTHSLVKATEPSPGYTSTFGINIRNTHFISRSNEKNYGFENTTDNTNSLNIYAIGSTDSASAVCHASNASFTGLYGINTAADNSGLPNMAMSYSTLVGDSCQP